MKNLLALLLLFVVCSCGYSSPSTKEPIIITHISVSMEDGYCNYYTRPDNFQPFGRDEFRFIDTCGKFNIGDSIKFTK